MEPTVISAAVQADKHPYALITFVSGIRLGSARAKRFAA